MVGEEDKTFYTPTMARLYTDQGRFAAAARIYRYLLDQHPERGDLAEALAAVQARLPQTPDNWPSAASAIERWVRLLIFCRMLRQLSDIRLSDRHLAAG
ncbi:conserved hypothetical protein [Desulfosarcina cetonica]|uniref:hypothetical protein n=1 Tax=Desulfosarcina cetonica TaxID=90730 RepID=UPI0006D12C4C|nr:hypothetical protein [Desulfosarcina cetonica]VTR68215.1 conserved hypothetical protein [Desulfosarcina cetonica]